MRFDFGSYCMLLVMNDDKKDVELCLILVLWKVETEGIDAIDFCNVMECVESY